MNVILNMSQQKLKLIVATEDGDIVNVLSDVQDLDLTKLQIQYSVLQWLERVLGKHRQKVSRELATQKDARQTIEIGQTTYTLDSDRIVIGAVRKYDGGLVLNAVDAIQAAHWYDEDLVRLGLYG